MTEPASSAINSAPTMPLCLNLLIVPPPGCRSDTVHCDRYDGILLLAQKTPAYSKSAADSGGRTRHLIARGVVITLALLHGAAGADPYRAILELRDLAERIERRVSQQIRRGFVEAERNEHRSPRRAIIRSREECDAAAPRSHRNDAPRSHSQRFKILGIDRCHRRRLEAVQNLGAPGHAAGMPMLELAAGN